MRAAVLAGDDAELAPRVRIAGRSAAQVNHRGQVLLLLQAGAGDAVALDDAGDPAIEERRGHLGGMARHHAQVQAVEPARAPVVPRPVGDHGVVADAVALRLEVSRVGDLVHADRARRGPVELERLGRRAPAPLRRRHRVARAFGLRERGEELGAHHGGGVVAEDRLVPAPGFRRHLVQRAAHREKQLGRLARDLVERVDREEQRDQRGERDAELQSGRRAPEATKSGSCRSPRRTRCPPRHRARSDRAESRCRRPAGKCAARRRAAPAASSRPRSAP